MNSERDRHGGRRIATDVSVLVDDFKLAKLDLGNDRARLTGTRTKAWMSGSLPDQM